MDRVEVSLGDRSYYIEIGVNTLSGLGKRLRDLGIKDKVGIVTNPTVNNLYGKIVEDSLSMAGFSPVLIEVPDGEEYKTLFWINRIYDNLVSAQMERGSPIVALGGGVIGDIAGFAAATYLRGIPYIQVPTTLLAQVDSSVGGKTGVNHPAGKNLIGAFYQPSLVYIDLKVLETLPRRELVAGLAEVVKYGVIADENLFVYIEEEIEKILELSMDSLNHIVKRSCQIKAEIVEVDEREAGKRSILNYGHTLGHALEAITDFKTYRHGEAIAIGMVYAARLAHRMGLCDASVVERQRNLLKKIGLPVSIPKVDVDRLLVTMQIDKKVQDRRIRFVLPEKIGHVRITADWDRNALEEILKEG